MTFDDHMLEVLLNEHNKQVITSELVRNMGGDNTAYAWCADTLENIITTEFMSKVHYVSKDLETPNGCVSYTVLEVI